MAKPKRQEPEVVKRPPDYVVHVNKKYLGTDGKQKNQFYEVGAGWMNDNGVINFNVVTVPGVVFYLLPRDET
jgi:hypothetical protein